jgi:hypothetical protein
MWFVTTRCTPCRCSAEFVGSLILGLSSVLITEKGHVPIVAGVPGFLLVRAIPVHVNGHLVTRAPVILALRRR